MKFCEKIQEVGYDVPLTSLFAHNFNIDKVVIAGIEFSVSADIISSATCIPYHGETWFKGMELDLDDYKLFLKPNVRDAPKQVFSFQTSAWQVCSFDEIVIEEQIDPFLKYGTKKKGRGYDKILKQITTDMAH